MAGFLGPISSKIRVMREMERRKRKSAEGERRRSEKKKGCTLSFYSSFFGEKKTVGCKRSVKFSKIRLEV